MKRGALWFVVAADIALAALFTPLAIENVARRNAPSLDVPATSAIFYFCLSIIAPLLLITATLPLIKGFIRNQAPGKATLLLHRLAFWAIFLPAAANIVLSLFIPNESLHASVPFVTGVLFLLPAGLAFINYSILRHQSWREAEGAPLNREFLKPRAK